MPLVGTWNEFIIAVQNLSVLSARTEWDNIRVDKNMDIGKIIENLVDKPLKDFPFVQNAK